MRTAFIIVLAVSVLCVLTFGPALAEEIKEDAKAEAKVEAVPAGQTVFVENKCQMCHTVYSAGIGEPPAEEEKKEAEEDAEEDAGPPDLSLTGAGKTAEWMGLFLLKKETLNEKKHMKRFKGSDEELAPLVDWLMTLKPAEKEAPDAQSEATTGAEKPAGTKDPAGCDHGEKAEEPAEPAEGEEAPESEPNTSE